MSLFPHHDSSPECALCGLKLRLAHPTLAGWFWSHVKPKFPRAHVSETYRDEVEQERAFEDGKSRLQFPYSAHNKMPSMAIDLFELDDGGHAKWDPKFFTEINAMNEELKIDLVWGAHFKTLGDFDHFQLRPTG